MKKVLSLMHDTAGKINRIKTNVKEFENEINKFHPEFLSQKLERNHLLDMSCYLRDINNMAIQLNEVIDAFYLENKANNEK